MNKLEFSSLYKLTMARVSTDHRLGPGQRECHIGGQIGHHIGVPDDIDGELRLAPSETRS